MASRGPRQPGTLTSSGAARQRSGCLEWVARGTPLAAWAIGRTRAAIAATAEACSRSIVHGTAKKAAEKVIFLYLNRSFTLESSRASPSYDG